MKNFIVGFLCGMIVVAVGGYFITGWIDKELKKKNDELKIEIAEGLAKLNAAEKDAKEKIAAATEVIGNLQGNIDSLMTVIAEKDKKIEANEKTNGTLEAENAKMKADVQPALDANPKLAQYVANLELMHKNDRDEIFTLKEKAKSWEDAFVNSEKKFQAQVKITVEYKALWEGEKEQRQRVESRLRIQDKRVSILEKRSILTIGSGVVAVVAVVVVASLVK